MIPMNPKDEMQDPDVMPAEVEPKTEETPGRPKFCIVPLGGDKFHVYKDGDNEAMNEEIDGVEQALLAMVKLIKANPVGGDEETGDEGGFWERVPGRCTIMDESAWESHEKGNCDAECFYCKRGEKKISVAPPLPRVMKTAKIVFADGPNEGQILFDVVYEPDGMADSQSLAHVHCLKANKIVKAFMDAICDTKEEIPGQVAQGDDMERASNIIAPLRLIH